MSELDPAASLGAISDLWVIIILIIPGFIMFRILSWLAVYEAKFDQFTTTIYSLICSLIVFVPVASLFNIQSLDMIRNYTTNYQFLLVMLVFAGLFGGTSGAIIKYTIRRKFFSGSPWDRFGQNHLKEYVTVYTTDSKEYVGWIKRISIGKDEKKEISLGTPKFIHRFSSGGYELKDMGEEMLFTESNILKILKM